MDVIYIMKVTAITVASLISASSIIYFGMKYYFKTKPKNSLRNMTLELPNSWFSNLSKIIKKNADMVRSNEGFSNVYVWKKGKYTLKYEEQFNTNDINEDARNFDLPQLITALITIEEKKNLIRGHISYNSLISYMSLDRTFTHEETSLLMFRDSYKNKLTAKPHVYVQGRRVM